MLLGLVSTAGAESTVSTLPIKVELDFSKYQFTAPEEITVTIRVTNVTDEKFTSPVSVLDPNGSIIEAGGKNGIFEVDEQTIAYEKRLIYLPWTRARARAARLRGT